MREFEKKNAEDNEYRKKFEKEAHEDLDALVELLGLDVVRKDQFGSTPTVVVKGAEGTSWENKEVHIGFPYGRSDYKERVTRHPLATGRVNGVRMSAVGDGAWLYSINI